VDRRIRFEVLYGRYASAVKAYVLRRADPSLADDIVAEVFLICWRRLDDLPAEPLPWLLGAARKVLSTSRRGERRRDALAERLSADEEFPAVAQALGAGDGVLAQALGRLSDDDRELLLLIAWDGMTPSAAAQVLGIKPATARVRLLRARRRLAVALEGAGSNAPNCAAPTLEASS
jgi:RNA polymerase sigma-70 factor, ECF subfamily